MATWSREAHTPHKAASGLHCDSKDVMETMTISNVLNGFMKFPNHFAASPTSFYRTPSPPLIHFACLFSREVPSGPWTCAHPTITLGDTTTRLGPLYAWAHKTPLPLHPLVRIHFRPKAPFPLPLFLSSGHQLVRDNVTIGLVSCVCT